MFGKLRKWISHHKAISIVLVLLLGGGVYYVPQKFSSSGTPPRYVLAAVTRGTLVASVTGTGEVSVFTAVDVKAKASGDAVYLAVEEGARVKAGALLVQLDSTDAEKAVRDAGTNLKSAQVALEKLQKPADALALTQAENALADANRAKKKAEEDLSKAYEDGFTAVASAFIDLPGVVTGVDNILNGTTLNGNQANAYAYYDYIKTAKSNAADLQDAALTSYKNARAAYDKNLEDYKNTSRYSDRSAVGALIEESYNTLRAVSNAVKNTKNFLDLVSDFFSTSSNTRPPSLLATHESSLQTYSGTTNTHLGDMLSDWTTIQNSKEAGANAGRSIRERTEALAKLKAGAEVLDVESQKLAIEQRDNALKDARANLGDYYVRAPFEGIVAKLNVKKGESVSPGTVVATVVTPQQIVKISLNEVDVSKAALGAKTTLTFDALPGLAMTGKVIAIDTLGTTTQGVVNYTVTIALDTQESKVKPGMTVSASIVSDVRGDALMVPLSAVQTMPTGRQAQGTTHSVRVAEGVSLPENPAQGVTLPLSPARKIVGVGISNESMTEITNGLGEGDIVVVREITAASAQSQSPAQGNTFRFPGIGGGAGARR